MVFFNDSGRFFFVDFWVFLFGHFLKDFMRFFAYFLRFSTKFQKIFSMVNFKGESETQIRETRATNTL